MDKTGDYWADPPPIERDRGHTDPCIPDFENAQLKRAIPNRYGRVVVVGNHAVEPLKRMLGPLVSFGPHAVDERDGRLYGDVCDIQTVPEQCRNASIVICKRVLCCLSDEDQQRALVTLRRLAPHGLVLLLDVFRGPLRYMNAARQEAGLEPLACVNNHPSEALLQGCEFEVDPDLAAYYMWTRLYYPMLARKFPSYAGVLREAAPAVSQATARTFCPYRLYRIYGDS